MSPQDMYALAASLGEAKNRQNVGDALTFMHDDIVLESPAWGVVARGKQENNEVLTHFFNDYPDYNVAFEGHVADETSFVGWGTVRMTMSAHASDARGLTPNGRRVEVPVTIRMTFRDGLIATEHFLCDLAQIAAQSGVSVDAVRANIFGAATAETA
jgi:predicted ester cyclase